MLYRVIFGTFLLVVLMGVTACSDSGGDDARESVPDVDNVVEAVEARDVDALGELVGYRQEACTWQPGDDGRSLACRFGEAEGTLVAVVAYVQCEESYLRSGDVPNALEHILNPEPAVYAAFSAPAAAPGSLAASAAEPIWEYAIVFSSDEAGTPLGRRLVIQGGKVVLVDFGCGEAPEQMVEGIDESRFIIPPKGGQTPTEAP